MREHIKINLLQTESDRTARRSTILVAGVFAVCVGALSMLGAQASYRAATHGVSVLQAVSTSFPFAELRRLIQRDWKDTPDLLSTPDGRFNLLFLGIGGEGHDGPQLTDTIIFTSFDAVAHKLGLVSIPRDLAYPLGAGRYERINSVNAYAEQQYPGEGAKRTAEAISQLLKTRIDRVVRLDFTGFRDLIDAIDGLDVNIENSFIDPTFPTEDDGARPYQWTSLTFTQGLEHMDGRRALNYARSRHGNHGEGTDFARSKRQRIVVEAIRNKLLSRSTLTNPRKVSELWTILSQHMQTDLTAWDALTLLPLVTRYADLKLIHHVLTDEPTGELIAGNLNGAFVLYPKNSDWSRLRSIVANPFDEPVKELTLAQRAQTGIVLEIKNGTSRTGFGAQVAAKLTSAGYTVYATGNARQHSNERTVIYDLTNGTKPTELAHLKKLLDANVSASLPAKAVILQDGTRTQLATTSVQFLIILGDSSLSLTSG